MKLKKYKIDKFITIWKSSRVNCSLPTKWLASHILRSAEMQMPISP